MNAHRNQVLRGLGFFGSGAACQFTPSMVLSSALAEAGVMSSSPNQVDQTSSFQDLRHARIGLLGFDDTPDEFVRRHRHHDARQHRRGKVGNLEATRFVAEKAPDCRTLFGAV